MNDYSELKATLMKIKIVMTSGEDGLYLCDKKHSRLLYKFIKDLVLDYKSLIKENNDLKKQLHDASLEIQELIEKDIYCPSSCDKLQDYELRIKDSLDQLEKFHKKLKSALRTEINIKEIINIENKLRGDLNEKNN